MKEEIDKIRGCLESPGNKAVIGVYKYEDLERLAEEWNCKIFGSKGTEQNSFIVTPGSIFIVR